MAQIFSIVLSLLSALMAASAMARSDKQAPSTAELARRLQAPDSFELYIVPKKNNTIVDPDIFFGGWKSHFLQNSKVVELTHSGTDHNTLHDYDTHVPLVFWGPNYVRPGTDSRRVGLVQIVPTLAAVAGIPPLPAMSTAALQEVFRPKLKAPPRTILLIVIDQGGWTTLQQNKGKLPTIEKLMAEGRTYSEAYTDYGASGTSASHAVLGTGTYPAQNGIFDNYPYYKNLDKSQDVYTAAIGVDMMQLRQPTLADEWARVFAAKSYILSYSAASRAALGMAGHGAAYRDGKASDTFWFEAKEGRFNTDPKLFHLPMEMPQVNLSEIIKEQKGIWREQSCLGREGKLYAKCVTASPRFVEIEGEILLKAIAARQQDMKGPDSHALLMLSLKAVDYCGHFLGQESLECQETMVAVDRLLGALLASATEASAGELLVVLTADHGVAPLPLFSHGKQIYDQEFRAELNAEFGGEKQTEPVKAVANSVIYVNKNALAAAGHSMADLARFVRAYKVDGQLFFQEVLALSDFERTRR